MDYHIFIVFVFWAEFLDASTVSTVTIQEGQSQTLSCGYGEVIHILRATYTGTVFFCKHRDVTAIVRETCHLMSFCKVEATDKIFTDSCFLSSEELKILFTCELRTSTEAVVTTAGIGSYNATVNNRLHTGNSAATTGIVIGSLTAFLLLMIFMVVYRRRAMRRLKQKNSVTGQVDTVQNSAADSSLNVNQYRAPLHGYSNISYSISRPVNGCVNDNTESKLSVDNVYSMPDLLHNGPPPYNVATANDFPVHTNQYTNYKQETELLPSTSSIEYTKTALKSTHESKPSTIDHSNSEETSMDYDVPSRLAVECKHGVKETRNRNPEQLGVGLSNNLELISSNVSVKQTNSIPNKKQCTAENHEYDNVNYRTKQGCGFIDTTKRGTTQGSGIIDTTNRGQSVGYMSMKFDVNDTDNMYVPVTSPTLVDTHSDNTYQNFSGGST